MLSDAVAIPTLPVKDLEVARKFYSETLGLTQKKENPGGVSYSVGSGAIFVYPSQYAGSNQGTAVSFTVKDLRGVVDALKGNGVSFEHYDMPQMTREGDVHVMGTFEAAWFKDPSGNIIALDNGAE